MFKVAIVNLLIIVSLALSSCSAAGLSSLQHYANPAKGYEFFYPNGWIQVDVRDASQGVDTVFHDFIERSENLSVIISSIPKDKTLTDLGTPTDIGYRFLKSVNSDPEAKREAELINAESREFNGKTYYTLEYQVKLPDNQQRHDLASVAVNRGNLYTFNLSTSQKRWEQVKNLFEIVVNSFSVY
jgi:photosystem II oxygen-evolving enhancer protein 2